VCSSQRQLPSVQPIMMSRAMPGDARKDMLIVIVRAAQAGHKPKDSPNPHCFFRVAFVFLSVTSLRRNLAMR
jgi:hypothetical protein